jgi:hypothetical protein
MWAISVKPKKASKKWHKRALTVNISKTVVVIEKEGVSLEPVSQWIFLNEPQSVTEKFFLPDASHA